MNTPEGKIVAASLLDNYNSIVVKIRNEPSLVRASSAASKANAQASTQAGTPVLAGASVYARLATVKVYTGLRASSKLEGTLKRLEEAIATGKELHGFVRINGENVSGDWCSAHWWRRKRHRTERGVARIALRTVRHAALG